MPDILPVRIMHRCMNRTIRVYFQFHAELAVQQCRPAQKTASTRTKPKESSFSTHSFLSLKTRSTVFHTSFSGEYGERT